MKRPIWLVAAGILFIADMGLSHATQGDFELTAPDGRRLLLKDNGTWRYLEAKGKEGTDNKIDEGELVLLLERKIERGSNCRLAVRLTNNLPYEVRSLVLYYSAYRANGVMYDSVSSEAGPLKPGITQAREIVFSGIPCQAIVRVQVVGGDRCEMGDLSRWSYQKGECLARVRVVQSDLVPFEK
jgi:hypothetical protein